MTTLKNWSVAVILLKLKAVPTFWFVTEPELPLVFLALLSTKVSPGKVTTNLLIAPVTNFKAPHGKPFSPFIGLPVPSANVKLAARKSPPSSAIIAIPVLLPMVILSISSSPGEPFGVEYFTVIEEDVIFEIEIELISLLAR